MSVASLAKFTVPLASDVSPISQGLLMPKLKYRFRVLFENFGLSTPTTELTKQVISASRPNVQFAPQVLEVYNSKVNYIGKPTWQQINISLRDDVTNAVSKLVGEQLQKQFDFLEQVSAAAACNYKFTTAIEILDGGNGAFEPYVLERWECYGCMITTADYQTLDYADAGPVQINLTLQADNCILTNAGVTPATSQKGLLASGSNCS